MSSVELREDCLKRLATARFAGQIPPAPQPLLAVGFDLRDLQCFHFPTPHVDADAVALQDVGQDRGSELDMVGQRTEPPDAVGQPGLVDVTPDLSRIPERSLDLGVEFPEKEPCRQRITRRVAQAVEGYFG